MKKKIFATSTRDGKFIDLLAINERDIICEYTINFDKLDNAVFVVEYENEGKWCKAYYIQVVEV